MSAWRKNITASSEFQLWLKIFNAGACGSNARHVECARNGRHASIDMRKTCSKHKGHMIVSGFLAIVIVVLACSAIADMLA